MAQQINMARAGAAQRPMAVVIPVLNPGPHLQDLIPALRLQQPRIERIVFVDSGSSDGSPVQLREAGFEIHHIDAGSFDHGGTRNFGVSLARPTEIVVFLTQDAIPARPDSITSLLSVFEDPTVGLAYGRQLPRPHAGLIERHARLFNYPARRIARAMPEACSLGIKAVFNSNSFAAYRLRALDKIGGFPNRTIMGEDQIAAARILVAGWQIVYHPDATVRHSHGYSILQEMRRYFDIGVLHETERALLAPFGKVAGEGRRFVGSELSFLLRNAPALIPEAMIRTVLKLAGYRLGLRHRSLPDSLKCRLAMNSAFFSDGARQHHAMSDLVLEQPETAI